MTDGQTTTFWRVAFIVALLALLLTWLTQGVISEASQEQSRVIEESIKKDTLIKKDTVSSEKEEINEWFSDSLVQAQLSYQKQFMEGN